MAKPVQILLDPTLLPSRQFNSLVAAPVKDIFFGTVAEVNVLGSGPRICSFNCAYCDLPPGEKTMNQIRKQFEFPLIDKIASELTKTLSMWKPSWDKPNAIIISGNGEPTLHPQIDLVIEKIKSVRDGIRPGLPIVMFSNAAQLHSSRPQRAANFCDERLIKLDAGNENVFKALNASFVRINLNKIILNLKKLKDVTIQSMFVSGNLANNDEKHLEEWMEILGIIRPKKVFITTVAYQPTNPDVLPAPEDNLHLISMKLERRTGIKSSVLIR